MIILVKITNNTIQVIHGRRRLRDKINSQGKALVPLESGGEFLLTHDKSENLIIANDTIH